MDDFINGLIVILLAFLYGFSAGKRKVKLVWFVLCMVILITLAMFVVNSN